MKYNGLLILILVVICWACRSTHSASDTRITDNSRETTTNGKSEKIETESSSVSVQKTETDTHTSEYIRTTTYNDSGNIQQIQEIRRNTRRNELVDSSRQRNDVSRIEKADSTKTIAENNIKIEQKTDTKTDPRPIQGWKEWGVWAVVAGVIVLLVFFVKKIYP